MKRSFGNRLFRLFLLFSITPALILTAFGYYLATETGSIEEETDRHLNTEIAGYYNDLIYEDVNLALNEYLATGTLPEDYPDFVFQLHQNDIKEVKTSEGLTPPVMQAIVDAAEERGRGFVAQKGRFFQFLTVEGENGKRFYAGIVHGEAYGELVELIQADLARQSVSRIMKPKYVFFLSFLLILLAAITIAAAYFFSARLSANLARPLGDLSEATVRIASGDFNQRVRPTGDREIRDLVESFNSMARQLDQTTSRLTQTERVAAWRQVARRFAHELKNPIQPILISLYRIEKQLLDTDVYDKIYEPLKAASDELKHLTNLAERFSSLAKLPEPSLEKTDLKELIRSVVSLYEGQLSTYGFRCDLPNEEVTTVVDPDYIREALHNIIQNAIDASSQGSRIILTMARNEDRIEISLQDFGQGMDPETVASARLPYFTTKDKGTGLGLAVVEKSISEMGGQLHVKSKQGHGTTVTMSLPYRECLDAGENSHS
jgi:signal transduction histidine kinase